MASPIKHAMRFAVPDATDPVDFRLHEAVLLRAICDGLGLPDLAAVMDGPAVRTADLVMLATEARYLMHGVGDWPWTPPSPRERPVAPMPPAHCETEFRSWFDGLCAECKAVDP